MRGSSDRDDRVVVNLMYQTLGSASEHLAIAKQLIDDHEIAPAATRCLMALDTIEDAETQLDLCSGIVSKRRASSVLADIRRSRQEVWCMTIRLRRASPWTGAWPSQAKALARSFVAYDWALEPQAEAI